MRYAGLTDNPDARRIAFGNPADWIQYRFADEEEARAWEEKVQRGPGFKCGIADEGWRFGFTFTMTTQDDITCLGPVRYISG